MIHPSKVLLLVVGLALAACTSPGRFGGDAANLGGGLGADGAMAADPSSPTYFNDTIGDRVLFAVDQSTLSPEARQTLTGQARWLADNGAYTVVIEGHADEQGTREYNLALGARRASSVQQFLIAQGVEPSRLRTLTYGKERPVELCSDETCYSQNRRAVTVLQAGTS